MHLYDGYSRSFSVAGYSLLLIQDEGQRYLLVNQCPHNQAPLDKATIEAGQLRCPLHGMRFDLRTGSTMDGCSSTLRFLPISYQEQFIGVEL